MTSRHTNLQAARPTHGQSSTSPCGSHYGGFAARTHNKMYRIWRGTVLRSRIVFLT